MSLVMSVGLDHKLFINSRKLVHTYKILYKKLEVYHQFLMDLQESLLKIFCNFTYTTERNIL